ncbi:hypothetical protein PTSG_02424 [Salpingoeca rosetta]|uniref:YEATS domain-containing protein n=1 Tax=Salpingoeca rosetta (strain ATCC 50818 / BSB-021) TaxID=946362 RepID=F2U261_SALR5|nr:uncharacterized protein PTSG_02424 [Salpingoeca rosetta]EGD81713.1 hypothetical protein PTSG_02424 [Salpingoeca rosetta]|eukprot:XP_004996917.1 hypothetical protein PTSG_02424 [Salpingoeca rosetta]
MAEKNVVHKRIVYGNTAHIIERSPDSPHTHEWKLYVQSATNEPLENFVKKVTFTLHPSFKPPTRVVDKPPFQVVENGWGEFEAQIKIQFHPTTLKSMTLRHIVRLFPSDKTITADDNSVVAESFDELVFSNPSDSMAKYLNKEPSPMLQPRARDYAAVETQQLKAIQAAKADLEAQMAAVQKQHKALEEESVALNQELAQLQRE